MNNKKVGFKEVWRALKQIPKTITIIRKVDKKGFTLIVMLSMIAGAFPVGKHDELLRNCMTYQKLYKAESYEREDM